VTDLAHAHLAALDACQPGQPRVYNLGSESGSSNLAVLDMCREFALQTREPFGVWGGLAEAERRIILERRGLSAVS